MQENSFGAFRAGLRYTLSNKPLHVVLLRAAIFFAFASAVWALLPLVARQLLGGDASFYGILLGAVGAGAIGGALIMPKLRERLSSDGLLLGAALITASVMDVLSLAPPKIVAIIVLLFLEGHMDHRPDHTRRCGPECPSELGSRSRPQHLQCLLATIAMRSVPGRREDPVNNKQRRSGQVAHEEDPKN